MTDASAPPILWPLAANVATFLGALVLGGTVLLVAPGEDTAVSLDENRVLADAPVFSWATLVDGTYTEALEAFVADHFPQRDQWMALNFWLKEHRGLRDTQLALYAFDSAEVGLEDGDQDASGAKLPDLAGVTASPAEEPVWDPSEPILAATEDFDLDDAEAPLIGPRPRTPGSVSHGILVSEGRAMQLFTGGPAGSPAYARAINRYAETLAAQVKIYVLIVPTAQAFYLPEDFARYSKSEPVNIQATWELLRPEITAVDVFAALKDHTDEYIYFRTDHHWTGRGAYYAYAAFCRAAGLLPTSLEALERRTLKQFQGSLYRVTRDPQLLEAPDTVEYWLPLHETTVTRHAADNVKVFSATKLLFEHGSGYGVFLGGDASLMIVKTAENPGRRALLLKNSYGNAFATFLPAHYERLLIVDYRTFEGSLRDLIADHEIDDLIILNGTITANAAFHIARVARVLDGRKP